MAHSRVSHHNIFGEQSFEWSVFFELSSRAV
jgi:hypothetical protein